MLMNFNKQTIKIIRVENIMLLISYKKIFSFSITTSIRASFIKSFLIRALALTLLFTISANTYSENLSLYRLGVGDKIKIVVHGEDDLTLETTLSETGSFTYPFLGEITAAGLSIEELSQRIIKGLKPDYLINPDINIFIAEYRQFFINGEVIRPGGYPYQPDLTLRKAVSLAGGFTDRASKSSITVIADGKDDGKNEKKIDLESYIQAGDIITVKQRFF